MKHFHLLCLWWVFIAACHCTSKVDKQARIEGHYLSAFEAIDSRESARAREHIEALAKLHPQDKRLPTLWALLAIVELRFQEALPLLEAALLSQPERADLWRHKGELLQSQKQCEKAKEAYEKALSLQPKDAEVRQSMAECLLLLGEASLALSAFQEAAEQALPMRQAEVVLRAVEAMNAQGLAKEAGPWLESLVSKMEEPSLVWELIAHSHIQAGAFSQAAEAFEEAVKTNPKELHYWEALSALYEREKDMAKAQSALEQGLEKAPSHEKFSSHILLAHLCKRTQQQACLQEHVQKALEHIDESSAKRLGELAALLLDIGKETEAFNLYWLLADEPSGRQDAHLQKQAAQLAHKLGKTHEATQACRRLQRLEPESACP